MDPTIEIRPLRREDDRRGFSCGQPDLDRFFQHYAGQNQFKLRIAVTYVAVVAERVVGFATVAAATLERADLPPTGLLRRMPGYPLPALRLARLGVEAWAQGLGVGRGLLRHVLHLAVRQRDTLGCVGVVADAKPEAVPFYERHGFVPLEGVVEGALLAEPTPMFLAMVTVVSALGA